MSNIIPYAVILIVGVMIGNKESERETLRDCATKGTADFVRGQKITCAVVNETK